MKQTSTATKKSNKA